MTAIPFGSMTAVKSQSNAAPSSDLTSLKERKHEFGKTADSLKSSDDSCFFHDLERQARDNLQQFQISSETDPFISFNGSIIGNDLSSFNLNNQSGEGEISAPLLEKDAQETIQQISPSFVVSQDIYNILVPAIMLATEERLQNSWKNGGQYEDALVEGSYRNTPLDRAKDSSGNSVNQFSAILFQNLESDQTAIIANGIESHNSTALTKIISTSEGTALNVAIKTERVDNASHFQKVQLLSQFEGSVVEKADDQAFAIQKSSDDYLGEDGRTEALKPLTNNSGASGHAARFIMRVEDGLPETLNKNGDEALKLIAKARQNDLASVGMFSPTSNDRKVTSTHMPITELVTYLPYIIANNLLLSDKKISEVNAEMAPRASGFETERSALDPAKGDQVRFLRFRLQPVELGDVLIKMRVRDSRVEIEIEAQSIATTEILNEARNALSTALENKGLTLNSLDIATQSPSNPTTSAEAEGRSDERSFTGNAGQEGFFLVMTILSSVEKRVVGSERIHLNTMSILLFISLLLTFCYDRAHAENICEAEMIRSAKENGVPLAVLYAVALTETGQRGELSAFAMNIHGRPAFNATIHEALDVFQAAQRQGEKIIDIGCMQINHFYHGAAFSDVRAMFNPRKNVDYAARFLKALYRREGKWTDAVERYHAGPGNAPAQHRYVCAVIRNMLRSGFGQWTPEAAIFCGSRETVSGKI